VGAPPRPLRRSARRRGREVKQARSTSLQSVGRWVRWSDVFSEQALTL
jgi:hypothetical protein